MQLTFSIKEKTVLGQGNFLYIFFVTSGVIWDRTSQNVLTNRFNVAVRLFSNRSQMTSKCGKNKEVAHETIAECVTWFSYHILTSSVIYHWTDARQNGIYLFYVIKNKLLHKNLSTRLENRPLPTPPTLTENFWDN